jgi:hypothetical protein
MKFFRLNLNPRIIFVLVVVCSAIMVFDSIIVALYANIRIEPKGLTMSIFIGLVIFFAIINYILLSQSNNKYLSTGLGKGRLISLLHLAVIIIQLAISTILTYIVMELVVTRGYTFVSVWYATFLSYGLAILCMSILCYKFLMWFKSHHDLIILLYIIAFSTMVVYLVTSLTLLNLEFSYSDSTINLRSMKRQISDSSNTLLNYPLLFGTNNYLSVLSFLSMWTATILQLRAYSTRLGNFRYWALVIIPLSYFLFPLVANQFGVFNNLRMEYGMQFNFIYIILVSPYKQIGGLLFGIVFWMAAEKIKRENLKYFMFISGTGMILLFNATVIHDISYILAPPFGIITLLFAGMASYFLLIGIFASSVELARDTVIRSEINKIAAKEHGFLKNLGFAETERVLERRLKPIMKKTLSIEIEDSELRANEDYKEMIREAINEVNAYKKSKTK